MSRGTRRLVVIASLLCASTAATAAPKNRDARAQFDQGVAAYTKGDYAAAAEALGASFVLEADAETLFAWAQTERKLGHCDRAIELYAKLLAMDLPDENKAAIRVQIAECKAIVAEQQTKPAEPPPPAAPVAPVPVAAAPPAEAPPKPRAWWQDPVGGALVGAGTIGVATGIVLLVQASAADADKDRAATYQEYESLANRAESRGRFGVISLVAGTALAAGGIAWYLAHEPSGERAVTTLVLPGGGGIVLSGRF